MGSPVSEMNANHYERAGAGTTISRLDVTVEKQGRVSCGMLGEMMAGRCCIGQ